MATSPENIIAAILDLAIDNGKIYSQTKNMLYKQREVYLRRLATNFVDFADQSYNQDLQDVTDNGATTTNAVTISNNITANAFIRLDGVSTQFLKADGSVDNNTYLTAASAEIFNPFLLMGA
jgi:hypothetical protein